MYVTRAAPKETPLVATQKTEIDAAFAGLSLPEGNADAALRMVPLLHDFVMREHAASTAFQTAQMRKTQFAVDILIALGGTR